MSTDYPLPLKHPLRSRWQAHWQRYLRCWGLVTHDEAGLTLIECLAAIVVVGFIGAAIAPVLVISVATRVQSQKAEQALALAQSEIDSVRTLIEQGGDPVAQLPPIATDLAAGDATASASAPNTKEAQATENDPYPPTYRELRLVDIDDDDEDDFGLQVFRHATVGNEDAIAFSLGVRVYDIKSVENNLASLDIQQASIGLASGQGDRTTQPLATLYTTVAGGENTQSLCSFADYLGGYGDDAIPTGCPQP